MAQERLQKYLSECSVASRRKAEELIKQGKEIDILFYFSDCDGKFPEKEPTYPTVFLRDMQMVDRYFRSFNDDNWIPKWVKVIDIKN